MSFIDDVGGYIKKGFEPGSGVAALKALNPFSTHGASAQPGIVTGPAADPSKLQRDPATGAFYDPTTGQTYTDASGKTPVANPNLAQQTAANFGTRTAMLGKIAGQDQTLDQVNAKQNALGATLQRTITDPNAPSVAATQLALGQNANTSGILGTAAGVGGANGYDARRNAVSAIAGANATTTGQAALLRQKEVADATSAEGVVLNQQGAAAQARENTNLTAASDFSKQAGTNQGTQQTLDEKADESKSKQDAEQRDKGVGLLSSLGTKALGF